MYVQNHCIKNISAFINCVIILLKRRINYAKGCFKENVFCAVHLSLLYKFLLISLDKNAL